MVATKRKRMAKAGLKKPQKTVAEQVAARLRREHKAEKLIPVLARRLERLVLKRDAALARLEEVIRMFRGEAEQPVPEQ